MNEFKDAIEWRGGHLSFIGYGIWARAAAETAQTGIIEHVLRIFPGSQISPFVAADEDWPIDVGVFDIEIGNWPDRPDEFCASVLSSMCRGGARLSWMMFDGVFNDVSALFSRDWASQIYAIKVESGLGDVRTAVIDQVRHSVEWRELVQDCRRWILGEYPKLDRMKFE